MLDLLKIIRYMETVYFKGTPCHTCGNIPSVGQKAPCYTFVTPELKEVNCADFKGKRVVLNVFPSLDTPVCAASASFQPGSFDIGEYRGSVCVDGFAFCRRTFL